MSVKGLVAGLQSLFLREKDGFREPRIGEVFLASDTIVNTRNLRMAGVSYLRADYPLVEAQFDSPQVGAVTGTVGGNLPRSLSGTVFPAAYGNSVLVLDTGTPNSLVRTTDRGATWAAVTIAAFAGKTIIAFRYAVGVVIAVFSDGSVYRSLDNGDTWSLEASFGAINGSALASLRYAAGRWYLLYALTTGNGPVFRYSDDNGDSWSSAVVLPGGTGSSAIATSRGSIVADGSGNVLACWRNIRSGTWYYTYAYSTDYGANWTFSDSAIDHGGNLNSVGYNTLTGRWYRSEYDSSTGTYIVRNARNMTAPGNFVNPMTFSVAVDDIGPVGRNMVFVAGSAAFTFIDRENNYSTSGSPGFNTLVAYAVEGLTVYALGTGATATRNSRVELASTQASFNTINIPAPSSAAIYYFMRGR